MRRHGGGRACELVLRVQVLNLLYHNYPGQRTLVVAHSNQALSDVFEKTIQRDVPARYLLRLGMGQEELDTDVDFSRVGAAPPAPAPHPMPRVSCHMVPPRLAAWVAACFQLQLLARMHDRARIRHRSRAGTGGHAADWPA